ncbi:MAG: hypothetical protein OQK55_03220 [Thermoanaerobaculales bacterium]|nr:hypothetical protein [Thermoanaerobaculales bacterium]
MPSKILILDPLTLRGRELLLSSDRLDGVVGEWDFRHTDLDEEHQIADMIQGPALVPPLEGSEDFNGADVIVIASDGWSSRHEHLIAHLDDNPETILLDLTGFENLRDRTTPSVGDIGPDSRQLRVAHPALFGTSRVNEVLSHLGALGGSLAVVDPASAYGREAIEILARQATPRAQGAPVDDRVQGHVLAFNEVAIESDDLQEDASLILPDLPLAITRTLSGSFHGHLAHLGLSFERRVDPEEVRDVLVQAEGIEIDSLPLSLDSVPDRDHVVVTPPSLSTDGTQLALTMMADGLRVGGALTAIEILEGLL